MPPTVTVELCLFLSQLLKMFFITSHVNESHCYCLSVKSVLSGDFERHGVCWRFTGHRDIQLCTVCSDSAPTTRSGTHLVNATAQ